MLAQFFVQLLLLCTVMIASGWTIETALRHLKSDRHIP